MKSRENQGCGCAASACPLRGEFIKMQGLVFQCLGGISLYLFWCLPKTCGSFYCGEMVLGSGVPCLARTRAGVSHCVPAEQGGFGEGMAISWGQGGVFSLREML